MADEYLTIDQVAELLQVSTKTIRRLVSRDEIPGFKVGGQWRFRRQDIDAWAREQSQQGRREDG